MIQTFVEDLWAHQEPGGPGPSDKQMAKMEQESGLPDDVAGRQELGAQFAERVRKRAALSADGNSRQRLSRVRRFRRPAFARVHRG